MDPQVFSVTIVTVFLYDGFFGTFWTESTQLYVLFPVQGLDFLVFIFVAHHFSLATLMVYEPQLALLNFRGLSGSCDSALISISSDFGLCLYACVCWVSFLACFCLRRVYCIGLLIYLQDRIRQLRCFCRGLVGSVSVGALPGCVLW